MGGIVRGYVGIRRIFLFHSGICSQGHYPYSDCCYHRNSYPKGRFTAMTNIIEAGANKSAGLSIFNYFLMA